MNNIGIMQGRLTLPKGRGIQFFPFDNWEKEFEDAAKIGLTEIEFIFDYDNYINNPLWTNNGIEQIKHSISNSGIKINAVCFDYFMRRPFFKKIEQREQFFIENKEFIKRIIFAMDVLEIHLLEIPLVDGSSMKDVNEKEMFAEFLLQIADSSPASIKFGLETDMESDDFIFYLKKLNHTNIGANYDSGNSSGLGYDLYKEIRTLDKYIYNIHIKDRLLGGSTVRLGTGNADFDSMFKALEEISYNGSYIIQAARGEDGKELETVKSQKAFIENLIQKYLNY